MQPSRAEIEQLLGGEEFDRATEAAALGAGAVPVLMEIADDHEHPFMRARAMAVLGWIKDRRAIPALTAALADGNATVRLSAIRAFAQVAGSDATDTLIGLLDEPDPGTVKVAIHALQEIGDRKAVAALETVKSASPHEFLRGMADAAASKIREGDASS
jgi:HEAT repeat protein